MQAPVQLEHRVTTVEAVVAELARKSGRDLRIKSELKDEVLYVSLRPHPAGELMALIARAASAEWSQDGGVYLGRSVSLRNRQAREDRAVLAKEIESARKPLLADDDAKPWRDATGRAGAASDFARSAPASYTPEEFRRRQARLFGMTPIGRLLSRSLRSLPTTDLAAIPRGGRVRYALRPTRRQRPLPAAASFPQYVAERAAFAVDVDRLTEERRRPSELQFYYGSPGAGSEVGVTPLLTVHRWGAGAFEVRMDARDGRGRVIDHAAMMFPTDPEHSASDLPSYARWSGRSVKPTGDCAAFVRSLSGGSSDPALFARLRNPVANEPLALLMTEPMDLLRDSIGAAEALVALPDETVRDAGEQLESNPKIGEFADGLAKDVRSEVKDGLWIGWARRPSEAMAGKASRAALAAFFREFSPVPSLDAVTRYAVAQNPEAVLTNFEYLVLRAAGASPDPDVLSGLTDGEMGGRNVLRAYGSLSPAQRSELSAGGRITLDRVRPGTRAILDDLIFQRIDELDPLDLRTVFADRTDPTLVLDALPMVSVLSLGEPKTELVAGYTLSGRPALMEMGSLGYVLENQEREGTFNEQSGYPMVAKATFVPGRKRSFSFDLQVSPAYRYRGYLRDSHLAETAPVPYDRLPVEYLAEFRKTYDYYRKLRRGG